MLILNLGWRHRRSDDEEDEVEAEIEAKLAEEHAGRAHEESDEACQKGDTLTGPTQLYDV